MSIMSLLDIGNSALIAQRTAIEVTGQNVSNVNTPGYSKQTAVLETVAVNSGPYSPGNGVKVATVQRAYDQFIQAQLNGQQSTNGEQAVAQSALQRVEPLFPDLTSDGLGKSIQDFFNSWQDLANNPQGQTERQVVLSKAQSMVDSFHSMNSSLEQIKQDANNSLAGLTGDINTKLANIADLNSQIRLAQATGENANALRDSRDQAIQDLSGKIGINCLQQQDGTVTVSLQKGLSLVQGDKAGVFSLQSDPANSGYSSVMLQQPGGNTGTDVTSMLEGTGGKSGELGGTLLVRDKIVNGFQGNIDELAYNMANQVNSLQSGGFGLNGTTGVNFFTPPSVPPPPATFAAGYSGTIALNISSKNDIAASSTDPTLPGNGTGNNVNALAIAGLANTPLPIAGGNQSLTDYYSSAVGTVGLSVQSNSQAVTQSTNMLAQLTTLRNSTSGVSLDEELSALISYQKAFEGAAKMITTGQTMLDTILNMVT